VSATAIPSTSQSTFSMSATPRAVKSRPISTGGAAGRKAQVNIGIQKDDGHKNTITNHEVVVLPSMTCAVLLGRDMLEFFDVSITQGGTTMLAFD